jgi:hypothetical protein
LPKLQDCAEFWLHNTLCIAKCLRPHHGFDALTTSRLTTWRLSRLSQLVIDLEFWRHTLCGSSSFFTVKSREKSF